MEDPWQTLQQRRHSYSLMPCVRAGCPRSLSPRCWRAWPASLSRHSGRAVPRERNDGRVAAPSRQEGPARVYTWCPPARGADAAVSLAHMRDGAPGRVRRIASAGSARMSLNLHRIIRPVASPVRGARVWENVSDRQAYAIPRVDGAEEKSEGQLSGVMGLSGASGSSRKTGKPATAGNERRQLPKKQRMEWQGHVST